MAVTHSLGLTPTRPPHVFGLLHLIVALAMIASAGPANARGKHTVIASSRDWRSHGKVIDGVKASPVITMAGMATGMFGSVGHPCLLVEVTGGTEACVRPAKKPERQAIPKGSWAGLTGVPLSLEFGFTGREEDLRQAISSALASLVGEAVSRQQSEPTAPVAGGGRANWLSNRVFKTYHEIIEAICDAWQRLTAKPDTITSIGLRQWAHVGQTR